MGRVRLTNNRARNEIPIESATSKLTRWACSAAKRLLTNRLVYRVPFTQWQTCSSAKNLVQSCAIFFVLVTDQMAFVSPSVKDLVRRQSALFETLV